MADKKRLTHIIDLEILPYRVIVNGFNKNGRYGVYHNRKTGKIVVEDFVGNTKGEYKELKRIFQGDYIAEDKKR